MVIDYRVEITQTTPRLGVINQRSIELEYVQVMFCKYYPMQHVLFQRLFLL